MSKPKSKIHKNHLKNVYMSNANLQSITSKNSCLGPEKPQEKSKIYLYLMLY